MRPAFDSTRLDSTRLDYLFLLHRRQPLLQRVCQKLLLLLDVQHQLPLLFLERLQVLEEPVRQGLLLELDFAVERLDRLAGRLYTYARAGDAGQAHSSVRWLRSRSCSPTRPLDRSHLQLVLQLLPYPPLPGQLGFSLVALFLPVDVHRDVLILCSGSPLQSAVAEVRSVLLLSSSFSSSDFSSSSSSSAVVADGSAHSKVKAAAAHPGKQASKQASKLAIGE